MYRCILLGVVFLCFGSAVFSQISEVECTVYRRASAYITLTPAHYNEALLPQPGATVYVFLYVNTDLPEGKPEGYYEIGTAQVIKFTPDIKSIIFKLDQDMDASKSKTGLPQIQLIQRSRVKISWTQ